MEPWMTTEDLSNYLQIPHSKIRHLIKQSKIPFHDKLGYPRFFKPEIDEWMRTPTDNVQPADDTGASFIYRDKSIKEYMLTASKILIGPTARNRLPDFIKKTVIMAKEVDRPFLYRKEFEPLMNNFNDYLRLSCQLGLIDNRKEEEREKHYYPTEYSQRFPSVDNHVDIKISIHESILDLVRRNMETIPLERHAIFLLWYLLKIREKGLEPDESHFDQGGESNFYPKIRLNFVISFCDFLFEKNRSREQSFLETWDQYLK